MEKVASYPTMEKAEAAGEMLIRYGMSPKLDGATLYVVAEDAEKARTLLGIAEEEEERQRSEPLHPCPKCKTPDPIWFGKRKFILFLAMLFGVVVFRKFISLPSWAILAGVFGVLLIAFYLIPEYECRRCGNRWTREPRREA